MRLLEALARLDARVVPRLARGLHRIAALGSRRAAGRAAGRSVGAGQSGAAGTAGAAVSTAGRWRPLPTTALLIVLAVVATAVWRLGDPPASGPGPASTVRVGVSTGDLVAPYLEASRAELDVLVRQGHPAVYALVSFAVYVDPDAVAAAVAGLDMEPVAAYARVPVPRRQTQLVRLPAARLPDDLLTSMAEIAVSKRAQAQTYAQLARQERQADLRSIYESSAALATAEAAAYRKGCDCVFALVVRATPAVLRELATRPGVRVVDAAPEAADISRTVFVAPLPEQVERVVPPPDDMLAPPTSGPP